jgi:hypothetical protein
MNFAGIKRIGRLSGDILIIYVVVYCFEGLGELLDSIWKENYEMR